MFQNLALARSQLLSKLKRKTRLMSLKHLMLWARRSAMLLPRLVNKTPARSRMNLHQNPNQAKILSKKFLFWPKPKTIKFLNWTPQQSSWSMMSTNWKTLCSTRKPTTNSEITESMLSWNQNASHQLTSSTKWAIKRTTMKKVLSSTSTLAIKMKRVSMTKKSTTSLALHNIELAQLTSVSELSLKE